MYRFNNDYNHAAHPTILKALAETAGDNYPGYGLDPWCEKASALIKKVIGKKNAEVHFLVGGTQANKTVIAHSLRPWHSVLAAESGHIAVHETGAIENSGHKVETIPAKNGKITAAQVEEALIACETSETPEHITTPGMLYISYSTEYGTIYSKKELEEIYAVCKNHDIYLFVDGARLGYGLMCDKCDLSIQDLANNCDVFYIGGTKCGAMFGEAVIILNKKLQPYFRNSIKENGAMLAKGWLLGLQFAVLMENNLYFDICRQADEYAMQIRKAFKDKKIKSYIDSPTNQQFVILTEAQTAKLAKDFVFENEGKTKDGQNIVRFCTAWSTEKEEVDALLKAIAEL